MIDGNLPPTTISPESQDESPLAHPETKSDFFNRPEGFSEPTLHSVADRERMGHPTQIF